MVLFLTHDQIITYLKPLEYEVGCKIAFSSVPLWPQCCHVSVWMSLCRQDNQSLVSAKGVVKFTLHCCFIMYNLQSNKYYPECKGTNFSTLEYGVS